MPDDLFDLAAASRVLEHPDTPVAYVEWRELLPLLEGADRELIGNLLGWSFSKASMPLGASRGDFALALTGASEDVRDDWMAQLGETTAEDFLDHFVPFLRNLKDLGDADQVGAVVSTFLEAARGGQPSRDRRLTEMPDTVHIEVTKSCNFACTMCSSRTGGWLSEKTMPVEVFGDMIRVFGPQASTIRINGYGETTIVPELDRYLGCLEVFKYSGIKEIITNLSASTTVYTNLFDRGFVLLVSWDATTAGLFEEIRVGADFAVLLERLRVVGKSARSAPERLVLLSTIQEKNLREIVPLVKQAADVGAGLVIFNMVNEDDGSPWMSRRLEEIKDSFKEAEEEAKDAGVKLRLPDHIGRRRLRLASAKRSSATYCDRPWREILVRWDGELNVCNMFNPFTYGTLAPEGREVDREARFKRLWEGPNAQLFRRIINSPAPHPYCRDCYYLHS